MSDLKQFLGGAFHKLISPELLDFLLHWKMDLDEVESLKQTLTMIQALYDESEVKQSTKDAVKLWLDHLKQLLHDVDILCLKLGSESQIYPHQTQQVRNLVSLTPNECSAASPLLKADTESVVKGINVPDGFGPKELQEINKSESKVMDIYNRFKSVAQEGVALGLNSSMGSRSLRHMILSQRPPTSSLVNRSKVFGRDEDMWKIIRLLQSRPSNNDNNFSVLPIVGIGGVGKTTLAQFVYNHEIIQKHFNLKAWVCVSEDYDVVKLTQKILESIPGSTLPSNSLDALQVKLKETLTNNRFLFVLDGMWNEIDDDMWNEIYERWDALRIPFTFGKSGSKILVTTRNKGAASILRTDHCHYHDLKGLSDKDCLEIFRRHAFMDENSSYANEKLKIFGEKILNKSKGLPLVVKIFAGVLRVKTENSEWKDILEKQVEPNINLVTHNSENGSTVSQNTSFNKFVHGVDPQIHLIFNMQKRSCLLGKATH